LYPIYIIGIIVLIKHLTTTTTQQPGNSLPELVNVTTFANEIARARHNASADVYLAVVPGLHASDFGEMVLTCLRDQQGTRPIGTRAFTALDVQVFLMENESMLEEFYYSSWTIENFFAALVIEDRRPLDANVMPPDLQVTIRMNQSLIPSTVPGAVVDQLQCREANASCNARSFLDSGYIALQTAVISAHAEALIGIPGAVVNTTIGVRALPSGSFTGTIDSPFIRAILGLYFVLAFSPIVQFLCVAVVEEKEKKLKMSMTIMGMRTPAFFAGWMVVYIGVALISVTAVSVLVWFASLFPASNVFLIWLLLLMYTLALIAYGFVVSTVITSSKAAG
jgi:hypothetical protein